MTLTEYTSNQNPGSTINLSRDGILRGVGSKQITITSNANPIIRVGTNLINGDITRSAEIENLIIVGNGSNVAILLEDVVHCQVRNITIVNCDVGIKLIATDDHWTEATRLEHVRMKDVNKGIQFAPGGKKTGNWYSRAFTHIDDVGISLKNEQNLTGIQIEEEVSIYNSFIKANIWSTQQCYGMWVNGEIRNCLINLNHEKKTSGTGGSGIHLHQNAVVSDPVQGDFNQGIFIAAGNLSRPVNNPWNKTHYIVSKTY
jgi:hypothetical protein